MASLRAMAACIGCPANFSIVGDFFGYRSAPPWGLAPAAQQINLPQFRAIHLDRRFAAEFVGDVKVDGDIFLTGADCAEQFDTADEEIAPGALVVIGPDGALRQSHGAYDTKVAGVVSGAGTYRPAIILDKQQSTARRLSISLVGKVFCNVDGHYGSIAVGDLLTSSATPGHAMKATDQRRAFGAIIGKALRPWDRGTGLIPILIALG